MAETVTLPWWAFLALAILALWSLLDRLLIPSGRWLFQRRINRVINHVNRQLDIKIRPFQLTKRQVLIDRLIFDPQVMAALDEHARESNRPRELVMADVRRYAREIVPAFNAYVYFRVGYSLARRLARLLYRVRLGVVDNKALAAAAENSTVIFVMNHRSNMDYVLVAFLAAEHTALSYAVGEWARVWPLQQLIRSMGAYFVRRNSNNPIYRRVLERYVAMATEAGVAQAMYPEGGLSRDGNLRAPRLGLLDYALKGFDPHGAHDVVFVPVGINYDRVLEDRTLLQSAEPDAAKVSAGEALGTTFRFIGHNLALMFNRQWYRFGYACVNFGRPVSARAWLAANASSLGGDLRSAGREQRFEVIARLGQELMREIGLAVPVLPVSLVASVLLRATAPVEAAALRQGVARLAEQAEGAGGRLYLPRGDLDYATTVGLRMLLLRHLVEESEGGFVIVPAERALVAYYANAIAHLLASVPVAAAAC